MLFAEVNKQVKLSLPDRQIRLIVLAFAKELRLNKKKYFSLAFVGPRTIRQLNGNYRGQNKTTDVLSFSDQSQNFITTPDDQGYLGEVVVCVSQAKKQAREFKTTLNQELIRLIIHGVAHLFSFEHEGVSAHTAQKMSVFEEKIFKRVIKK